MSRRSTKNAALRAVRDEIEFRRTELAALERVEDILARGAALDHHRCDRSAPDSPCDGEIAARWCRCCGAFVARRCEAHGGARSAAYALGEHLREHGGEYARPRAADDAS